MATDKGRNTMEFKEAAELYSKALNQVKEAMATLNELGEAELVDSLEEVFDSIKVETQAAERINRRERGERVA